MSDSQEKELCRLTDMLRDMASVAQRPEQVDALRKGAAALSLIFMKGSWHELEALNGPMTEEMKERLRRLGLDPERSNS